MRMFNFGWKYQFVFVLVVVLTFCCPLYTRACTSTPNIISSEKDHNL